jgi:hypothetical protein
MPSHQRTFDWPVAPAGTRRSARPGSVPPNSVQRAEAVAEQGGTDAQAGELDSFKQAGHPNAGVG